MDLDASRLQVPDESILPRDEVCHLDVEPIAADLRPEGDGRQRAFLKIVAGLLGLGFDDLYQREKRRERRRRMVMAAAVGVGLLILGAVYWSFRSELGSVRKEAGLLTTEYKNVRPKNKDAEKRILAAAHEVDAALTVLEQARQNTTTAAEYKLTMENVQKVLTKPAQAAKPSQPKVIVFAVNGAEWDILRPLLIQGQMPNLKKVLDNGTFGKLKTISEPNCPKVFTTFATSVPPEESGITGFVVGGQTASTNMLKAEPLWSILSKRGITVGMANVPATFPVMPVNGYMISGMLTRGKDCEDGVLCAPKLSEVQGGDAVYPRSMVPELEKNMIARACPTPKT